MKRRASVLVGALLLLSMLFLLGLASMSQSVSRHRAVAEARAQAQARQLALAGLADLQAKLALDVTFPPPIVSEEQIFSYTEFVHDHTGQLVGYYTVSIDGRRLVPYQMLAVVCLGRLGPDENEPLAEARIDAEIDLAEFVRGTASTPNPYFYQLRTWSE
ncbi:MAG: hypothetical protein AB7S38_40910 [Vulcanimicrobiota bacterium]